jgi:hypothetical protein
MRAKNLSDIAIRDETKEVRLVERPPGLDNLATYSLEYAACCIWSRLMTGPQIPRRTVGRTPKPRSGGLR